MDAQADSATPVAADSGVPAQTRSVYLEGVISGVAGAVAVAAWFLYLDFSRGRLLYTPTVLGTIFFHGQQGLVSAGSIRPSLPMTLLFTLVHGAVFVVIGIALSRLLDLFAHRPNAILTIFLLFVILGLGFVAFAMTFSALPAEVLSWPDILLGNMFAAVAMVAPLWRRRVIGT